MKDRGQERALRHASDIARGRYCDRRRSERAAQRARLLRGLEHSLFGSRMPDAHAILTAAAWTREPLDAACPRCGTSRAPFEHVREGCAECRGRRLAWDGLVRLGRYAPPLSQWTPAIKRRAWRAMALALGAELGRQVRDAIDAGRCRHVRSDPLVAARAAWHRSRRLSRGSGGARTARCRDAVARGAAVRATDRLRARRAHSAWRSIRVPRAGVAMCTALERADTQRRGGRRAPRRNGAPHRRRANDRRHLRGGGNGAAEGGCAHDRRRLLRGGGSAPSQRGPVWPPADAESADCG